MGALNDQNNFPRSLLLQYTICLAPISLHSAECLILHSKLYIKSIHWQMKLNRDAVNLRYILYCKVFESNNLTNIEWESPNRYGRTDRIVYTKLDTKWNATSHEYLYAKLNIYFHHWTYLELRSLDYIQCYSKLSYF